MGGAERSVQFLAEELQSGGCDVTVITTGPKDEFVIVNNVSVYYLNTKNLYWLFNANYQKTIKKIVWHSIDAYNIRTLKPLIKLLKKINPDIIHTHNLSGFSPIIWKLAAQLSIPVVHTLRDYYLLCPKSTMYRNNQNCLKQCLDCKLYSFPKKRFSHTVEAVVGISNFILNKHFQYGYFAQAKIKKIVYNSVKQPIPMVKDLSQREIVFGFVGRLSYEKGVDLICKAFIELKKEGINNQLLIFGKSLDEKYEKRLKNNYEFSNINFAGYLKPEDIYKRIDVLIVPSLWQEPFGRIVIEAYSYGIPVIANNVGGLAELVNGNETGFLFDNSINDLLNKIRIIIKQKEVFKKMVVNAMTYHTRFNQEQTIAQHIKIYENLLM